MRPLLHRLLDNFRYRADRRAREAALSAGRQLARNLRDSRRQQKIELEDLAETLTVSPVVMAKLENGDGVHHLGIVELVAWAHRLDHTLVISVEISGDLSD